MTEKNGTEAALGRWSALKQLAQLLVTPAGTDDEGQAKQVAADARAKFEQEVTPELLLELFADLTQATTERDTLQQALRKHDQAKLQAQDLRDEYGLFCANCGRPIALGEPVVTGPGIDHEEVCCSQWCHDEHERLGCPQGEPGGSFRNAEWYGRQLVAVTAERDQLLAKVEGLREDKARLDAIEQECWDIRYRSSPNADAGDSSITVEIISHFMEEPRERVVGENYCENLRAALDQARTADPYPPARPEYDKHGRPVRSKPVL